MPYATDATTRKGEELWNASMSPLFLAVVEATEEAVYNSLAMATTVQGQFGRRVEALPLTALRELIRSSQD